MAQQKNPIIGALVGGLLLGIPDLIKAAREKRAANKAEKLEAAGNQQLAAAVTLAAASEAPQALQQVASATTEGAISLPPELLEAPIELTIAYIVLAACGLGLKAYAKHKAAQAAKP